MSMAHALLGGLHLSGPAFEPIIDRTVDALTRMTPDLVVPGHCTGWRAQHALAAALPNAWVAGSSGSSFRLAAAARTRPPALRRRRSRGRSAAGHGAEHDERLGADDDGLGQGAVGRAVRQ